MYLLFLLFPLILFPAFGESIPDYDDPYAPIFFDKTTYTWTDKIKNYNNGTKLEYWQILD